MNKNLRLLMLAAAVIFTFTVRGADAAQAVNVEQFLGMARTQNHSLLASAKDIEAAYYQVLASVGYQRLRADLSARGNYNTAQTAAGVNVYNPVEYSISPSLTQVIDISGVNALTERQAILGYEASRAAFENTVNAMLASAEQAYWGVVIARDKVALQKDILRQRQENLRVTEEKFKQQLVPKLDVIRATSSVSEAHNLIVNAETTLLNSLASLRNFVGGTNVEPSDANFYVPELSFNVSESVALENHPNVKQRKILLAQSEVQKQLAKKGMAPTLSASASWDMLYGTSLGRSSESGEASVGLSLNVPIADGNETKYDSLSKSTAAQAAAESLLEEEASTILNLTVARNNWLMARALESNMKQQVERSNEELKITELMYNEGMGSQLDLITAQTDNQSVRTEYLNAVMGMYSSIVDLRRAMGDYAPTEEGSWRDAVVRYGKGNKTVTMGTGETGQAGKNSQTGQKPAAENDEVLINVRGNDVPIDSALEWLKEERQPGGQESRSGNNNVQLTRKLQDGGYESVEFNNDREISYEDALNWLEK